MTEKEILELIQKDQWMYKIILAASTYNLPDWAIAAGFIRNKVWDHLHGYKKNTPPTDIDLVYFDKDNKFDAKKIEKELSSLPGELKWEVVNQATAHGWNEETPYASTEDAISKWPETATAVGITMDKDNKLILVAPHGIGDLVHMIIRPTPAFMVSESKRSRVKERMEQKHWLQKWPELTVAPF